MTPIPPKIRKLIDENPFYKQCALQGHHGHTCAGRITLDHSIEYGGKQLQQLWAIGPFCASGHGVDGHKDDATKKELRYWVALNRATDEELDAISKVVNYKRERQRLNDIWGIWKRIEKPISSPFPEYMIQPGAIIPISSTGVINKKCSNCGWSFQIDIYFKNLSSKDTTDLMDYFGKVINLFSHLHDCKKPEQK